MYERLLDKNVSPSEDFIKKYLGTESYHNLLELEKYLNAHYDLKKEIKFPFGNRYGWGYKYSHKSSHLCYAFFESGAFTITLQLGDPCVSAVNKILPTLSAKANELWKNRYHCGKQGGWIHYRVISTDELSDIFSLIAAKKKAAK
ncbi:MAG: DUF3788 domain-containing protein [Clostridiales bacterium]|jgi:hypothetical protein|nr:DUF3788 domain-containing protein [Clostridiales bacterium]MCI1962334.1 DUF3788 domain-containing protein [Clostridiales bacterium]MCI2022854.1 DUF3788 domain-containing protein [Clostridiales bacterium]MCI2027251.1 DUF3788 domain-containing protein [Clostridiales bacterium]